MVLQAALAALLTRLGAGSDIPIGSPIAGRTDAALDDLVGFFVNTLGAAHRHVGQSEPARTDRARARQQPCGLCTSGPAVRAAGGGAQPERSLSRHPLFQVMLVLQNNAPANFALPGLTTAFEAESRPASAKFDLAFALGEQRATDGSPAGIDRRHSNTPRICSIGEPSRR